MPVQNPIIPADSKDLYAKILPTKRNEEGNSTVVAEIKAHLGKSGHATYEQTIDDTREVGLATKCIVFLIRGTFEIGSDIVSKNGVGYPVDDEKILRLQRRTAVVIINTN